MTHNLNAPPPWLLLLKRRAAPSYKSLIETLYLFNGPGFLLIRVTHSIDWFISYI